MPWVIFTPYCFVATHGEISSNSSHLSILSYHGIYEFVEIAHVPYVVLDYCMITCHSIRYTNMGFPSHSVVGFPLRPHTLGIGVIRFHIIIYYELCYYDTV